MPTGYTADIKDGIDFKTYAMNCARAFGACVMLRDEPGGGDYGKTPTVRLTGEAWAAERRANLTRDVQYHERAHAAEVARAAGRTAWVQSLRAAL